MAQVVFDFSELITGCLHEEEVNFTNAINQELDSKKFISELFRNLQLVCQEELSELLERHHFHLVKRTDIKNKIERLVNNPYSNFTKLCQIPLGQEPRLYGNLQKVKYTTLYLFKALIADPNHLIYEENKFNKLKNLTCLFSKTNCLETKKMGLKKKR